MISINIYRFFFSYIIIFSLNRHEFDCKIPKPFYDGHLSTNGLFW